VLGEGEENENKEEETRNMVAGATVSAAQQHAPEGMLD
jgi:hypothetical protein